MNPSDNLQALLTDAVVKLIGKDSNAFVILGYVWRCILSCNHPELADEFMREVAAGDYNHLLVTVKFFVFIQFYQNNPCQKDLRNLMDGPI